MRPSNCSGAGQGDGCGCSGAGKFWEVDNATVNSNYVHDNFDVGLWADTNNNGFTFKGNFIKNNVARLKTGFRRKMARPSSPRAAPVGPGLITGRKRIRDDLLVPARGDG